MSGRMWLGLAALIVVMVVWLEVDNASSACRGANGRWGQITEERYFVPSGRGGTMAFSTPQKVTRTACLDEHGKEIR